MRRLLTTLNTIMKNISRQDVCIFFEKEEEDYTVRWWARPWLVYNQLTLLSVFTSLFWQCCEIRMRKDCEILSFHSWRRWWWKLLTSHALQRSLHHHWTHHLLCCSHFYFLFFFSTSLFADNINYNINYNINCSRKQPFFSIPDSTIQFFVYL